MSMFFVTSSHTAALRVFATDVPDGLPLAAWQACASARGRFNDTLSVATVDGNFIEQLYAQGASVYDWLCGPILQAGRREAMHQLALQPGNDILEIGIGTGLTTPLYPDDCRVTGIDVSEPMLREAARHIDRHNIQLFRMDAARLTFPDQSFDVVYAAYV